MTEFIGVVLAAPFVLYWAWGKGVSDERYRPRRDPRDTTPIDPLLR